MSPNLERMIRPIFMKMFCSGSSDARLTQRLLEEWPEAQNGGNLLFVFLQRRSCKFFHSKLYLIVARELAKRGKEFFFLFDDQVLAAGFPVFAIDGNPISFSIQEEKANVCYKSSVIPTRFPSAHNGLLDSTVNGVDFGPEILCTLRKIQKRYNIDFSKEESRILWNEMVRTCDMISGYCFLLQKYGEEKGKRIIFCGWESNSLPNSAFLKLSRNESGGIVEYLDLNRGYMHYFAGYPSVSNYVVFSNLSRGGLKSRLGVTRKELDEAALSPFSLEVGRKAMEKVLAKKFNAGGKGDREKTSRIIDMFRSRGRKVFVLYAHLFYDTAVDDSSRVFKDMTDWIIQTIDFFRGKDDLLLLKPHPVELSCSSPAKVPNETLASLTENLIDPENMHLMHPLAFKAEELAPLITGGIIWRSSVAMELTYLGVPCAIAGNPPYSDLNLPVARSKEEYFERLEELANTEVTQPQVDDVLRYIACFWQKHIEVPQLFNNEWNAREMKKLLNRNSGDISDMVEKLLHECT